jgi:hypothetical protein
MAQNKDTVRASEDKGLAGSLEERDGGLEEGVAASDWERRGSSSPSSPSSLWEARRCTYWFVKCCPREPSASPLPAEARPRARGSQDHFRLAFTFCSARVFCSAHLLSKGSTQLQPAPAAHACSQKTAPSATPSRPAYADPRRRRTASTSPSQTMLVLFESAVGLALFKLKDGKLDDKELHKQFDTPEGANNL